MGKLRHVAFASKEPEKQSEFYRQLFGFEEVGVFSNGSRIMIDGLFNLAFLQQRDGQLQGINHYGFKVERLQHAVAKLPRHLQPPPSNQPFESKPAEARFIDPWGNDVDLSSKGFMGREEKRLPAVRLVVVQVSDPENAATFYKSQFDLYEIKRPADGTLLLSDGTIGLLFTKREMIARTGIQCVGIQVEDLRATKDELGKYGVEVSTPSGELGDLQIADPEGNCVVLSAVGWTH